MAPSATHRCAAQRAATRGVSTAPTPRPPACASCAPPSHAAPPSAARIHEQLLLAREQRVGGDNLALLLRQPILPRSLRRPRQLAAAPQRLVQLALRLQAALEVRPVRRRR
eukprot:CAMPEP_0203818460 /NCGR_PEP_ID=MMETSP0115-20131106/31671_1 /ASSEMBLY_ACC=CAM_ASM_000227 /TAXON_ID=33651 /ORGANISM="Bicosoecid sp, Strain ms1" /LENGTH=110 /DNA_ID=CAMNT_0050727427 /DNA_START=30 /DNA_END=359 /DNA_ORIENTATION=+